MGRFYRLLNSPHYVLSNNSYPPRDSQISPASAWLTRAEFEANKKHSHSFPSLAGYAKKSFTNF